MPAVTGLAQTTDGDKVPNTPAARLWSAARRYPHFIASAFLGLAFLTLYTYTLAPGLLGHDCGDWQAAGATLGISHSPGSPAYTIITWLVSLVPVGNLPARVSFVSALVGAAGVIAVYVFMLMLLGRWLPALVSALTLGFGGQWWAQSSVADPYNAIPAMIAVFLILLLLWQRKGDIRLVWGGAFLAAFGFAYHPTILYFIPVLLAGVLVLGPWRKLLKPKALLVTLLLIILGVSFYAYLPIRSATNPAVLYEKIDSLGRLYRFVTVSGARSTGSFAVTVPGQELLRERLSEVVRQGYYPSFAFLVLAPAITLLYPVVLRKLKQLRRYLIWLAAGAFFHMAVVFAISGVYLQYYLPLLLYFSIWTGFSLYLVMTTAGAYLEKGRFRQVPGIITAVIYMGVLALGLPHIWPFVNHHDDHGMRTFGNWAFSQAKPGAVILANWDSEPGLLYMQKVEGQRPDLKIYAVPPDTWRNNLNDVRKKYPKAQVLLARSLPFDNRAETRAIGSWYFISIKGRTYQDQDHDLPWPAAVQLFEVTS